MDSQGNLTELLSKKSSNEFVGKSVLEAMQKEDVQKFIVPIEENLDLLPANNFLSNFSSLDIYRKNISRERVYPSMVALHLVLDRTLNEIRDHYDFILIDTPPSLSEQTTNALCASEYVVVLFEGSNWCYSAIPNFMDSVISANEFGKRDTKVIGILRNLNDVRRNDEKAFNEMIEEDYPNYVFKTVITRKASVGRLSLYGFNENSELKKVLEPYRSFYKELIERVKG